MKQTLTPKTHRHNHGFRASHGLQVPLLSSGEPHLGYFTVPASALAFKGLANREVSYERSVMQKVRTWIEWKERQGWLLQGKPKLLVPVPKPNAYKEEQEEDLVRVYVQARFYRTKPLYITLDDHLERLDQYERYGLSIPTEALVENPLPKTAEELVADDSRNPLIAAEERRKSLGLSRVVTVKDGMAVGAEVVATPSPQGDAGESSTPR